jgi:uncharacterized Zn finger protein
MPRRFLVSSSSHPALPYVVTYDQEAHEGSCQCQGYAYHGWCKHLTAVVNLMWQELRPEPSTEPVVVEIQGTDDK